MEPPKERRFYELLSDEEARAELIQFQTREPELTPSEQLARLEVEAAKLRADIARLNKSCDELKQELYEIGENLRNALKPYRPTWLFGKSPK